MREGSPGTGAWGWEALIVSPGPQTQSQRKSGKFISSGVGFSFLFAFLRLRGQLYLRQFGTSCLGLWETKTTQEKKGQLNELAQGVGPKG